MPSPEKVSKEAGVEENDDDDIFNDAFEACSYLLGISSVQKELNRCEVYFCQTF